MKKTSNRRGRPTKYTRNVILRFIAFMKQNDKLSVRNQVPVYNKTVTTKRDRLNHIPLLVAMAREGLNMKNILTDSGGLVRSVREAVARLN